MADSIQDSSATKAERLHNEEANDACGSSVNTKQTFNEVKDESHQGNEVKDACECNHVTEKDSKEFQYTFQQKEQVKNEGEQCDAVNGAQQNREEKVEDIPCHDGKVSEDSQGHHEAMNVGHFIDEDENHSCNSIENIEKGSDAFTHEYTCSKVIEEEEVKDTLQEDEVNDTPTQNEVSDTPQQNENSDLLQQNDVKDNDKNEQKDIKDNDTPQRKGQIQNEGDCCAVSGAQQQNKEDEVKDIPCQYKIVCEDFQGHNAAMKEGHCIEENENHSCNSMENIEKGSDVIPHEYTCSEVTDEEEVKDEFQEIEVSDIPPQNEVSDIPPQNEVSDIPPQSEVSDIPPQNEASDIPPQNEVSDIPPQSEVSDIPQQNEVGDIPPQSEVSDIPQQNEVNGIPQQNEVSDIPKQNEISDKPQQNEAVDTSQQNVVKKTTQQNYPVTSADEQREDIPEAGISKENDDIEMEEVEPTNEQVNGIGRIKSKFKDVIKKKDPSSLDVLSQKELVSDSTQCDSQVKIVSNISEKKPGKLGMDNGRLKDSGSVQTGKHEVCISTGQQHTLFTSQHNKTGRKVKKAHKTERRHHEDEYQRELFDPNSHCEEHQEMLKYYCKTCRQTKCTDCIVLTTTCRDHMDMITKLHTHICKEKVHNT